MLVLLGLVICGAWGNRFRWTNGDGDGVWTNYKNWEYYEFGSSSWKTIGDDTKDYPGYNNNSNDAEVFINTDDYGNSNISISIPANIKISSLYIESSATTSVTFTLSDGVTLSITGDLNLGNVASNSDPVNFIITGSGNVSVTENIRCKNTAETSFLLQNDAMVKAKSIVNEKKGNGATVNVSGDGTGIISLPHQNDSPDNTITINSGYVNFSTSETLPVNTNKYYWKASPADSVWTNTNNWETENGEAVRHYPGYKDRDTAVFDAGEGAANLSVADGSYTLNIKSTASGGGEHPYDRSLIQGVSATAKTATINVEGTWLFDGCSFGTLNLNNSAGGTTDTVRLLNGLVVNNLKIENKRILYGGGNSPIAVSESLTNAGDINSYSALEVTVATVNNGIISGGDVESSFNGGYSGTGTLTVASGTLNFNGGYSGTGTLTVASGTLNFNGGYSGTGKLSLSTGTINFNNSDANLTECAVFSAGTGTVNFNNTTNPTTNVQKTLTLPNTSLTFYNLNFGGNIKVSGKATVEHGCQMTKLSDSTTNALEIDAAITCNDLFEQREGTKVTVKEGKSLTIKNDYRAYGTTSKNEIIIEGTLSVGNGVGGGEGNPAELTVASTGTIIAGAFIGRLNSSGEDGKIALLKNNGTIQTKTIYVEKIISTGTEEFCKAGGELTVTDWENSKFGNVTITSSSSLKLNNNIIVSGNWKNNAGTTGFNANGKNVTFVGEGKKLSGSTAFANAIFNGSTTFSDGNSFSEFECTKGDITLSFGAGRTQQISEKLTLKGEESKMLRLSCDYSAITDPAAIIVVSSSKLDADYLSIGEKLNIQEAPVGSPAIGSHKAYGSSTTSVPASSSSQNDYMALFKKGWDLGYEFEFKWKGGASSKEHLWFEEENWDPALVPGLVANKTEDAKVLIPDGRTYWPELSNSQLPSGVNQITLSSLQIGENSVNDTTNAATARLTLSDDGTGGGYLLNISTGTLINYGIIEYKNDFRIYKDGDPSKPINDTEHSGWVEYSGGGTTSAQIVTNFSDEDDYANLLISGLNTETSDAICVAGNLRVWKISTATKASLQIKNDFTFKGSVEGSTDLSFSVDENCTLEANEGTKFIFAGSKQTVIMTSDSARAEFANIVINAGSSVSAHGTFIVKESLLNENTDGGFTASTGTITFTGSSLSITGKNNFNNLIFADGSGGTVTDKISVTGTTLIANGNGNELKLTGANSFAKPVIIGDSAKSLSGGKITLNSDGNLQLAEVTCYSLEVQSSVTFTKNVDSPVTFTGSGAQINGNGKTFSAAVTFSGSSATLNGNNTFSGTVTFSGDGTTLSGNNSFNKAVFDENMSFGGSNSFSEFVCETAGKSLTFAAGSNQTVTKLTIRGTETGKINLTGIGEWQITPLNHAQISIAHAIITNSKNSDSEPIIVYAKNGYNTDGTGNTNWIFAGHKYIWTGAASTDWGTTSNWSPTSVPREYADVEIPGGKTNYPKLTQDLNLKNDEKIFVVDTNGDGSNENESVTSSVAIDSGAVFDFAGNNLTVNALSSEGRIRVLGTEIIAAAGDSGIKNLPLDSSSVLTGVIEYYGDFGTRETPNFGDKFSLLEFTAGSGGEISGSISVTGKTLISNGAGVALSLSGDNTFTGGVKITSAGNIVLKGKKDDSNPLALLGDVDCSKLNLKSDVVLNGNVTTTDSQDFDGKVFLDSGIIFNAGSSLVSFGADILSKSENSAITLESEVSLGGNVTTALSQTFKKNMTLLSDVVFTAGSGIKFDSASELSITSDKSAKFKSPVTSNCDLAITVPTVDFDLNASFKNTESTNSLSLKTGTSLSFKNAAFEAGKLIVEEGSGFSQTGVNPSTAVQKVYGIENNGSCVWDSESKGGTLVLSGSISGTKAGEIIFNKKNVTLSATPITISGVFFDLTVPDGINATNGAGLVVRRNFIVEGAYLHNDQNLTLGTVSFADGRKYASANNEDGSAGLISCASSNLGNVTVVQETTRKKFATNIEGISFSLDDATAAAGSVEFAEKFKTLSLTNAASTNFAILFDSSCEITNDVIFGTNGNVIFGTKENSSCIFANSVEHTAGDSKLAGSVKAASAKFARSVLTQNTKIDCDSNSVIFTDVVDSDSSDTPRALSIGTESSVTSVKFEKSVGTSNPLASLLVYGNAEFGGNLVSEGIINLKGDILAFADVNLLSKNSYILADGSASRTFGAASGSLTFASELFVDIASSSTVTISSDLTWQKILCAYSGKISAGAVNLSGTNLVLFGSSYSADDPRYSGSDSRFAYFGYESLAYKPSSGTAGFKAEFSTIGTKVLISENFYANGLDFAGCSFVIPNQSASNPLFNSTSAVTEKQWGIPYAVVFNSEIANCSAGSSEGAAFVTAAKNQNVTDRSGNSGFQFAVPQISGAYSVSDSVVCLSFDMSLENSNGEVSSTISLVSALENGGIFYNGKSLAFDGKFYTESDGTNCSVPLSESNLALTDIPAHTPLYLKVSSAQNNWNTDASATFAGTEDSTDRSGIHRNRTTDLSLFEGLFFAAEGKTMCRNYGIGLWSENDSGYTDAKIFATIDKARPVLVDFFAGQELHSKNTGTADSQKFYDSHNFIELRYSEPVDIGNLLAGATEQNQNRQAQTDFDSAEKHGGAITNNSGSDGMTISGFVSIEKGELTAGYKSGSAGSYSFNSDTNKCHALYRKFSKNAGEAEKIFPNRIRISVAGYVDEENPVSLGGSDFHNWIGYIDSSSSPAGAVVPLANRFITDLAVDSDGLPLKNIFDENNSSRSLSVNDRASTSSSSLYGEWDCSHPVFAAYVTNFNGSDPNVSWINGDGENRQYEMLGTVDSNTNAYIDTIEMHLFDNTQNYSADVEYKWIARKGWISSGGNVIPGFEAPESSGGSRAIPSSSAMTLGGIRRSSLDGAISAFTYKYSLDGVESDFRTFAEKDIAQHVKSPLFRVESLSETFTDNDEPYLGLTINPMDSKLPIRTTFTVTYEPKKSFITDLAGNRLIQTDSGSDKKILHSIDITPPSFTMTISPVGENKIYAVFTKPLAYKGTYLSDLGNELPSVLQKISSNLEFVYSEEDNVDTSAVLSGDKAISVVDAELAKGTSDYTAILFTLDRKISLDDVEKIWIRVNDAGEGSETLFGNITASYIQDKLGNPVPVHTCHALSDFAVNAVNMLYAYSDNTDDDGWDEHEIYGQGLAPESSDYAVHDFSEDGKNYNRVRSGRDIVFQFEFIDSDSERSKTGVQNGETLSLVYDEKSNIRPEWKSSKYNLLTGSEWRIWLDNPFEAFSLGHNSSPLSASLPSPPGFADVEGSDILKNMIWKNEDFNIEAGKEYQFFFKILDSSGNVIQINHDGDTRTPRIPLYTFRMPKERISAGDFSYLDLWSFTTRDLTRQRGGVTILNNVINAALGEKTAIEVNMKNDGNLNVFVMTLDGNIIKRLSKGSVKSGTHYFYWDGKNGAGNPVARGLYFVRVSGNGIDETRKVMVVK